MTKQGVAKKIGSTHYVHKSVIHRAHKPVREAYRRALFNLEYERNTSPIGTYVPQEDEWNVIKYNIRLAGTDNDRLSLLLYDDFFFTSHPILLQTIIVDMDGDAACVFKKINYRGRENKQILHRKEELIGEAHPEYDRWAKLTMEELFAGLLSKEHKSRIGYQRYWEALLAEKGLEIMFDVLMPQGGFESDIEDDMDDVDHGWENAHERTLW